MEISAQKLLVLKVVGKYNRPIGIQPLQRNIRFQILENKLADFEWVSVMKELMDESWVQAAGGFYSLTESGKIAYEKALA